MSLDTTTAINLGIGLAWDAYKAWHARKHGEEPTAADRVEIEADIRARRDRQLAELEKPIRSGEEDLEIGRQRARDRRKAEEDEDGA